MLGRLSPELLLKDGASMLGKRNGFSIFSFCVELFDSFY